MTHRPVWTTAVPDWAIRIRAGDSIIPPPIFPEQAEEALAIFKSLRVTDLPGKPTFGECSKQWVFDFVSAVFGAYDAETGNQLIREFYLLVSKKNTKSTIAAGIMLTATILCWREDEEHLILAPTKEVADNSFKPAAAMVRADEELSTIFHVQDHIRTISHRHTKQSLKVVAADTDTVSGKKAGRVLVDEHWLFGKRVNAESMFQEALGGQISRDEGWVIYLTTQSDEPPSGVFKDKLQYFRDVRDGKLLDSKSLGVLYEFPDDMIKDKEYLRPENFHITNPNLGRSVSRTWLEDNLKKNLHKVDGGIQTFLAKHLNIEIGLNLRSDRWAGADFWEAAALPGLTLDALLERCDVIDVGIDGGGLDDLLGFAAVGRDKVSGRKLHWGHAWAHPSVLERRKGEAARFKDFAAAGDLTLVQQIGDDVTELVQIIKRIFDAGLLDKIGVDPYGIGTILDALVDAGIPEQVQNADGAMVDVMVGISQGWKMAGAIKTTERWLAEGQLCHGGRDMMAWCVGNAKIEPAKNAMYITKQASGYAKIDPLLAMINAITLMMLNPAASATVYNDRGFMSV